jgi:mono/diheme cytochrome c family protein/rhodanese-related sulfurtransferase
VNRAVVVVVIVLAGCNSGSATPAPASQKAPEPKASEPKAPEPPPGAPPAPAGSAAVPSAAELVGLAGKPLYLALCKPCHGADAKGYAADHAPSLVNPTFLESATDDFLRRSIAAGRPGTSMAAYGKARGGPLDDAGVDRLVRYLREQGPPARSLSAAAPGDVANGAAVYATRCFSCHGDARTRGEAVALANPGFLTDASDAFVRHAIAHGRPGTKMEAFAGVLSDAQIDSVVSYIRTMAGAGPAEVQRLPEPTGKEPLVLHPSAKTPSFTLRADPCPTLPGGEVLAGCKPDPRFVSVEQVAAALAARRRLVIIDARPASDWRRVHIAGAVSIPYLDMKRLDEVPRDGTWVVAYCACPHHLSGIVIDELRKRGYAHSAVLDEGINEWQRRNLPVVAAEGVTPPPAEPRPANTFR